MNARSKRANESPVNPATPVAQIPVITVSPRGAARIRQGHVWIYCADIDAADGIAPGSLVHVHDGSGHSLGTALYSSTSQIAVRMISPVLLTAGDLAQLICQRVRDAVAYRQRLVRDSNAYRVIFSEADFLPGLIVDRYDDLLTIQVLTQAMDQDWLREAVLRESQAQFKPAAIFESVEPRIRELENLPARKSGLLYGERTSTIIQMNGIRFAYDALAGQKTGAFLDQRENYAAAAQYARGRALDVFCYQGGFSLHLAKVCEQVTGVDSSRPALEAADRNAQLNGVEVEWIEANAFDLLKDYASTGEQYDTIVVDPPGFAKTRRALDTAIRGYKELNLRALKMLRPGGILVTCSCSFHVSEPEFLEMLAAATVDAHRTVRILERRSAAKDHPVLLTVPETNYLKCIIATVT
jgi:23S rRNA (cytosine1962-C5)-methyltransferase